MTKKKSNVICKTRTSKVVRRKNGRTSTYTRSGLKGSKWKKTGG